GWLRRLQTSVPPRRCGGHVQESNRCRGPRPAVSLPSGGLENAAAPGPAIVHALTLRALADGDEDPDPDREREHRADIRNRSDDRERLARDALLQRQIGSVGAFDAKPEHALPRRRSVVRVEEREIRERCGGPENEPPRAEAGAEDR